MGSANKDMRNMEITGSTAKDVKDTAMLDVTAKEWPASIGGDNPQKQYVNTGKVTGPFGAKGRGGS